MSNINKKEKILLILVLGACVAFLYIQLYLPKQTTKINALRSSVNDYESKLDSLDVTSRMNIKLRKELDDLETKYRQTIAAFPKDGRVPQIAFNYSEYTKKSNIALSKVDIGDPQEFSLDKDKNSKAANNQNNKNNNNNNKNNTNNNNTQAVNAAFKLFVIPTDVTVSGEYLNVNSFLSSIENADRLAKIDEITIKSNAPGKVTAELSANYYYVPGLIINLEYPFNDGTKNKEDMFKE